MADACRITTRALVGLDRVIKEIQPDIVFVHGDTITTFVASLAALYNQVKIGHVETELRTWDKYSPFPEEMNRQLTGFLLICILRQRNRRRKIH